MTETQVMEGEETVKKECSLKNQTFYFRNIFHIQGPEFQEKISGTALKV
jgi:hypothetical protein